jgi:hypothetical protein
MYLLTPLLSDRTPSPLPSSTKAYFSSASVFFLLFLLSLSFLVDNSLSSSSSSSFSVRTSSGLYHTGGCVSNAGPPESSAIVKWNAATNVFGGVYLTLKYQHDAISGSETENSDVHNIIRLDQTMLNGLLQSHSRTFLILEYTQVERERSRFFLYFGEYSTCCFHLELVRNRMVALVDRRSRLLQPRLRHRKQFLVENPTGEHKK